VPMPKWIRWLTEQGREATNGDSACVFLEIGNFDELRFARRAFLRGLETGECRCWLHILRVNDICNQDENASQVLNVCCSVTGSQSWLGSPTKANKHPFFNIGNPTPRAYI
jgi:hypothetical protein